jgi:hypothetical protein
MNFHGGNSFAGKNIYRVTWDFKKIPPPQKNWRFFSNYW